MVMGFYGVVVEDVLMHAAPRRTDPGHHAIHNLQTRNAML
jgi:hypothetical protein